MKSISQSNKEKICELCGRSFEYRKKWEKNWDQVKFCSDRCRAQSKGASQKRITEFKIKIVDLLQLRSTGKTICPSEILQDDEKQDVKVMEMVRQAARLLVSEGVIEILQKSKVVDPSDFRGPIRLRLKS
ncbi:MAG: DUF2256 and DUF3253 domain-containing protein [Bdellovibrio sp.]|nr:DUF2256 and DUF3253 domain-containing protein [Bdellovibrio sp.]